MPNTMQARAATPRRHKYQITLADSQPRPEDCIDVASHTPRRKHRHAVTDDVDESFASRQPPDVSPPPASLNDDYREQISAARYRLMADIEGR